jgi:membrane protease YdiL (CAAX protease family)
MFLFHLTALAQAKPAEEVTPGALMSGMLVLAVMAASLGMIVVWATRIRETGHALPAAQRGVLRVPAVLTIIALGLSLLMIILMGLVALENRLLPPVAAAPNGAAAEKGAAAEQGAAAEKGLESKAEPSLIAPADGTGERPAGEPAAQKESGDLASAGAETEPPSGDSSPSVDASAEPSSTDSSSVAEATGDAAKEPVDAAKDAVDAAASGMTPADMKRALVQTVIMNVVLFVVLGSVVFLASGQGRVFLVTAVDRVASAAIHTMKHTGAYVSNSMWPDLDEAPERSSPLENRSASFAPFAPVVDSSAAFDSPFAAPAVSSMMTSPESGLPGSPALEEPFSWATEWRFAGEVFLAAYVPTAVLRIMIVLLTVGILGQEPEQHPFLEMMDSGVGIAVLMLIVLTAVFMAPLVEELQFRVVMLGGIAQLGQPRLGLVVSSMLFAFAHGFPDSLALVPLAFALGYTYLRRRSYITVMMVHFLFNGFNMVLALMAML